jgi:hypothetical protein
MGERIICQGCGQRISLPEGYRRNKIQCPECGVITAVSLPGKKRTASETGSEDTPFDTKGGPSQGNLFPTVGKTEPEPEPPPKPKPVPPATPNAAKRPKQEQLAGEQARKVQPSAQPAPAEPAVWTCSHCGEWQPRPPRGRKARCPVCKTPVPDAVKAPTKAIAGQFLQSRGPREAVPQTDWSDDPEDSKPYRVDATEQPACPGCGKPMEPQAIICLHCGLDLRDGVKTRTIYDVITRRWDAGLVRPLRFVCFAAWQCVAIPPMIWGMTQEGHAAYAIVIWIWFSLMVAFLLGTYDRIDLHRNARGKVRLVKTWYFCFVPREPLVIDLVQYEGIVTGQTHELEFSDYLVLFALCFFFVVPGVFWYIAFMRRDTWFVALTKDHGHPDLCLYRGWSGQRAKEIGETLRTAVLPQYSWY